MEEAAESQRKAPEVYHPVAEAQEAKARCNSAVAGAASVILSLGSSAEDIRRESCQWAVHKPAGFAVAAVVDLDKLDGQVVISDLWTVVGSSLGFWGNFLLGFCFGRCG